MSGDFEVKVDPLTGRAFTTIHGVRVEVRDEAECARASFVVCVRKQDDAGHFTDNVHTVCAFCSAGIVHRPYAPKTPPKICVECAMTLGRKES